MVPNENKEKERESEKETRKLGNEQEKTGNGK